MTTSIKYNTDTIIILQLYTIILVYMYRKVYRNRCLSRLW